MPARARRSSPATSFNTPPAECMERWRPCQYDENEQQPQRVPVFACDRLPRDLAISSEMEVLATGTPRAYGAARTCSHPEIPIPTFALYLRPEPAILAALRCSFHLWGADPQAP